MSSHQAACDPIPTPQLAVLEAELAILDEIDSGLDIDALRDVAKAVNGLKRPDRAVLMITHYQVRLCPGLLLPWALRLRHCVGRHSATARLIRGACAAQCAAAAAARRLNAAV